jgi:hypothetical protein
MSIITLLLISNTMLRNLSFSGELNAYAIATGSPEYGFCSNLIPSIKEKVSSLGLPYINAAS